MRQRLSTLFLCVAIGLMAGTVFATPAQEEMADATPSYHLTTWANRPVWPADEDNVMLQGLEEMFGVELTVEVVPAEYSQKLTLQAATGELPDAFTSTVAWATEVGWARDGLLLDLTDHLDTTLANYKAVRTQPAVWDSVTVDGRVYSLPSIDNPQDSGPQIREDWLANLGLSKPTNLDEFRAVSRAFTFDDPDGNGIDDTFAGAIYSAALNHGPQVIVFGAFDAFPGDWYLQDGEYIYGAIRPEFKAALSYFREMTMEGIYSTANIEANDWGTMMADMYTGKYGIFYFPVQIMTSVDDRTQRLRENTDGKGWMVPFAHLPTSDGRQIAAALSLRPWNRTALNADIEQPERLLEVFNYMMSEEGSNYVFYGIEGTHYEWDNGVVQKVAPYTDALALYNEGFDEQFLLFSFRSLFGPHLDPPALEAIETIRKNLRYAPLFNGDLEAWPRASVALNELQSRFILRAVTEADFDMDAEFDEFVADWKAAGGNDLLAEANSR